MTSVVEADVAVVGAGAIGLAVALELRRAGVEDVVVVDANPAPGQGSTSRANGGVRAQFTTEINVAFSRFTIDALAELDRASNGLVGLRRIGYLFMAATPDGEASLRAAYTMQRSCGLDVEWLDAAGVLQLAPFVRPDGLRAGTFCASDGTIDPHGVVMAMWSECRRMGVRFRLGEQVDDVSADGNVVMLRTVGARISATHAVNAAGPQAARVAAMAGVELPVQPFRRNLACTEPAPDGPVAMPMCVDTDTGVLVRREAGGYIVCWADPGEQPSESTQLDPSFLMALAQRVGNRFPFLESVAINERKCWAGLYPETPDHHAIIGSSPECPRLLHCAGFGGHGIMHSLAAGRAAAELIRDGRCSTFDLHPLRPSRFAEGALTVETAVL